MCRYWHKTQQLILMIKYFFLIFSIDWRLFFHSLERGSYVETFFSDFLRSVSTAHNTKIHNRYMLHILMVLSCVYYKIELLCFVFISIYFKRFKYFTVRYIIQAFYCNFSTYSTICGPGISVGIATGYGLEGPRIESRWGRDFPHPFRPSLGPTQSLTPCLYLG
jgi:hypothetical protein